MQWWGFEMNEQCIISQLTYISYATQRDQAPDISPYRWGKIYGQATVEEMEEIYQREQEDKFGSCKMCGDTHAYADMSARTCKQCEGADISDYIYDQRIDMELMA